MGQCAQLRFGLLLLSLPLRSLQTLQHSYLLKVDGKVVERPQHMLMRVSCGIHWSDWTNSGRKRASGSVLSLAPPCSHGSLPLRPPVFSSVCSGDMKSVIETYNLMSLKWFTHATPTLFNAGTQCPQLSSWSVARLVGDRPALRTLSTILWIAAWF